MQFFAFHDDFFEKMFYHRHRQRRDLVPVKKRDPEEHVTCLAESLTAFINSLTEDEDDGDDSEDDDFNEE